VRGGSTLGWSPAARCNSQATYTGAVLCTGHREPIYNSRLLWSGAALGACVPPWTRRVSRTPTKRSQQQWQRQRLRQRQQHGAAAAEPGDAAGAHGHRRSGGDV
jgi:hypothetical protein